MIENIEKAYLQEEIGDHTLVVVEPKYLSVQERADVQKLLEKAYHQSGMPKSFMEGLNENKKQICGLVFNAKGGLIAFRVVKPHLYSIYPENVYGDYPKICTKHLCVDPLVRSQGIGRLLIKKLNEVAFEFFDTPILWGASGEIGGLSLYKRCGAVLHRDSIRSITRAHPEKNEEMFLHMLNDSPYKWWRLDHHIPYAWYKSDEEKSYLLSKGFKEYSL